MLASVRDAFGSLRVAVAFLTRIPVGRGPAAAATLRWAPAHFPAVGAALGGIGGAVFLGLAPLEPTVRGWIIVAVLALATGAFHEDGLADTADALGGARDRERMFEILKDSRVGTFGAVALCCSLGLRAALLAHLLPRGVWALVASQAASRFPPVVLLGSLPYVTPAAARNDAMSRVDIPQLLVAAMWTSAVLVAVVCAAGAPLRSIAWGLAAQALAVAWLTFRFRRRAGGITGDFLGATQQVGEIAFLCGLAVALRD